MSGGDCRAVAGRIPSGPAGGPANRDGMIAAKVVTWICRVSYVAPAILLASAWFLWGVDAIQKHHLVATSIVGLVLGIPLLVWRTSVAARQLETSNEIAATANRSRADSVFADGSRMLGEEAPETRWAGINTLIALVDEHPEYMERVVTSFCAFLRPGGRIQDTADTPGKSQDQKKRILEAMGRWLRSPDRDGDVVLDLERVSATGVVLSGTRLSNARLASASLDLLSANRVDFSNADFSRRRTRFSCRLSFFTDCTFDGAILTDTDFSGVDFTGCTFVGADISGMKLRNEAVSEDDVCNGYPRGALGKLVVTKAQLEQADWTRENPPDIAPDVVDTETEEPLVLKDRSDRPMASNDRGS